MAAVEPIRDKSDVSAMAEALKEIDPKYERMFWLGLYTGLRIGDILRLRVADVVGKKSLSVVEQKTQHSRKVELKRQIVLNPRLRGMLSEYCKGKKGYDFLIPARNKRPGVAPASRFSAYRAMRQAAEVCGLKHVGTHSLRKTFGYFLYMENHKDVGLVQQMLQHRDGSTTLRYIGVNSLRIDDAYEGLDF